MQEYTRAIKLFKAFMVLPNILLYISISTVFYLNKGLTFEQITILKTIQFITVFCSEIPSGILADLTNKKRLCLYACILYACSYFLNATMNSFGLFCFSSICWGIANALLSGTKLAWLYDYLKMNKSEKQFSVILGETRFWDQIITAVAILSSSFLFEIHNSMPYFLNGIIMSIAVIVVCFLPMTDNIQKSSEEKKRQIVFTCTNANKNSFLLLGILAILIAAIIFTFDTYQLRLLQINFPVQYNGMLYFSFTILTGIVSKYTYIIYERMGVRKVFGVCAFLFIVSLPILAYSNIMVVLAIFYLQEAIFGIFLIIKDVYINEIVSSEIRATAISIMNFASSIFKSILFFVGGKLVTTLSISWTYTMISGFLIIVILVAIAYGLFLKKRLAMKSQI